MEIDLTSIDQRAGIVLDRVAPEARVLEIPASVHDDGAPPAVAGAARWHVIHTRSRQEKALAWFLKENEIGYFLPLRRKVVVRKGRQRKTLLPLFTGYLMFRADEEARYTA